MEWAAFVGACRVLETVFRTEDLPAADRFDSWYQMTRDSIMPTIVRADDESDFRAVARVLDLGEVQVHTMRQPKVLVSRSRKLITRSDFEQCLLTLVEQGSLRLAQAGRGAFLGPGEMVVYDSSHPFEGRAEYDERECGFSRLVGLRFPRAMLPHPDLVNRFLGARLPNRCGMHALIAAHMRELVKFPAGHPGAAAVGAITLDLVTALLTYEADTPRALPPESQQRTLLARIDRFIDEHLRDPALSPATIAAAHYISVRYLHKLFRTREETVASHIRRRRLHRCHVDLADPRQATRPARAIAASWGFTDSAHFSRLFKAAYGISASDHRHCSLRQPESPPRRG